MRGVARRLRAVALLAGLLLGGQLICAGPVAAQPPDQPPDVTGLILRDARVALHDWNPKVSVAVDPVGGEAPKGTDLELALVVSQRNPNPAAAVAVPQIELSVTARVPDVLGLTQAAADDLILRSGLQSDPSPSGPPSGWVVLSQFPAAGTAAKWTQRVNVILGPPPSTSVPATVEVPDLRGQSENQARAAAGQAGLQVRLEATGSGTDRPRVVTRQDPAPGTRVPRGSTVRIALGTPVAPATAPASPVPGQTPGLLTAAAVVTAGSVLLLLALLLLLGLLLTRAGRRRRRVHPQVHARLRPAGAATIRLDRAGTRPDITVSINRREVPPEIRFEEVRP
jgi:hypothetical protein